MKPSLKSAHVKDDDIFFFYTMKIRSVLEYAAPVFFSMLTKKHISDIERIQKIVFKIILGHRYNNYELACQVFSTTTLYLRRETLALKFALSCLNNPQHSHLFKQRKAAYYTLRNTKSFEEPYCFTSRYYSSPIPTMTRMLNEHFKIKNNSFNLKQWTIDMYLILNTLSYHC